MPSSDIFLSKTLLKMMFDYAKTAIIEERPDLRDPELVVPKCYAIGFINALLSQGYKTSIEKDGIIYKFEQGVNYDIDDGGKKK